MIHGFDDFVFYEQTGRSRRMMRLGLVGHYTLGCGSAVPLCLILARLFDIIGFMYMGAGNL